ncbi:MAG: cobalamin biosynthesis protein CobW [Pseudomonadota bacterium]
MPKKISATVITGFLGAGKTTLIRHLIENASGKRIALIINEFGDLGVDGEILKGCGIEGCAETDMIELSNGCICCTVAEDFLPALTKLIERDEAPDHIVIETSGLALPQPLVRAFNWPEIRTRVTVDGVVTVVDGPAVAAGRFAADEDAVMRQRQSDETLSHETPLSELFEDQLACADMVVVNKSDLMADPAQVTKALTARVREGVSVISAARGQVQPGVLLGLGIGAEDDLAARHEVHHHHHHADDNSHHHDHDAFESFVVDLPELSDATQLTDAVSQAIAAHDLLRVKGFAAIAGKPARLLLQAVGPRIDVHFDRPFQPHEARATRLVVIGLAGLDRAAISAALQGALDAAA